MVILIAFSLSGCSGSAALYAISPDVTLIPAYFRRYRMKAPTCLLMSGFSMGANRRRLSSW